MSKVQDPCKLEYTDKDGVVTKLEVPITTLKSDAFGLTFFNPDLSLLTTVTWDNLKSFSVSGSPSADMIERSKVHQSYYSDRKKPNSMNVSL